MLNAIKLVFLKELTEVRRDRRSLLIVLFLSMIMPLSMLVSLHLTGSAARGDTDMVVYQVVGAERAPKLISFLNSQGLTTSTDTENARVTLVIPEDFQNLMGQGRVPQLAIEADVSKAREAVADLRAALQGYSNEISAGRLVARGVSPVVLNPFRVNVVDSSGASFLTRYMATTIIFVLLWTPVYSLMPAAIDTTAGERERHGTFPLLLQPLSAINITIGKFLMLLVIGLTGLSIAVVVTFIGYTNFSPPDINFSFDMSILNGVLIPVIALPSMMFLAALMMAFASFAKTFKEGQSYVGMGAMVPMLFVGVGFAMDESKQAYVPFWAEQKVLAGLLSGDPVSPLPWVLVSLAYIAVVATALFWMSKTMQKNVLKG